MDKVTTLSRGDKDSGLPTRLFVAYLDGSRQDVKRSSERLPWLSLNVATWLQTVRPTDTPNHPGVRPLSYDNHSQSPAEQPDDTLKMHPAKV